MAAIRHRATRLPAIPWGNYLRVPAGLSALLLLVWFPLILRLRTRAVPAVRRSVRGAPAHRAPARSSAAPATGNAPPASSPAGRRPRRR